MRILLNGMLRVIAGLGSFNAGIHLAAAPAEEVYSVINMVITLGAIHHKDVNSAMRTFRTPIRSKRISATRRIISSALSNGSDGLNSDMYIPPLNVNHV